METPEQIFRKDISEEEIKIILTKLGKYFKNVKCKFTEYSESIHNAESLLNKIEKEGEAFLIQNKFFFEKIESILKQIEEKNKEIDILKNELDLIIDDENKQIITKKIENKTKELEEIKNQEIIQQKIIDNN